MKPLFRRTPLSTMLLGLGLSLGVSTVQAADRELLDILLANGAIDQAEYDSLLEKEALTEEDVSNITLDDGGLQISSVDGDFEFNLGGRLHLDYFHHEHQSGLAEQPASGTATRRARIEIDGSFQGGWGYAAEFDLAANRVRIKDIKIGYEGAEDWTLYAGQQKQPYSLSLEMSSNDIPFAERALDNAMVATYLDRAIGLRFDTSGSNWFFAGGLFGDTATNSDSNEEGWAAMGRFIYTPVISQEQVLHLGVRAAMSGMDNSHSTRIKDKTTEFSGFNIVDTGVMQNVDEVGLYGPEFAYAQGPLTILGEYTRADVKRGDGLSDLSFDGYHVGAAWSLTGESRAPQYRMSAGEFKGVQPMRAFDPENGTWGGVELVARYSELDLNDDTFTGGSVEELNAGVNWYLNRNVRFMFDWMHVLDTDESDMVRTIVPGMDVFTVRAQYNY